ncbi:hypothetical protein PC117_g21672 [Phytophthora cactorum]|uniref:Uncharacterized protein n=1 Tax=Phytophthora cactorum TaxID=29920 RepID=A0A8T1BF25_9STRA|nr:hypothetical protein PC117_g21672 [Phytophthora cactorum]
MRDRRLPALWGAAIGRRAMAAQGRGPTCHPILPSRGALLGSCGQNREGFVHE